MYNAVVNEWKDVEPQITFDVRQPQDQSTFYGASAQIS